MRSAGATELGGRRGAGFAGGTVELPCGGRCGVRDVLWFEEWIGIDGAGEQAALEVKPTSLRCTERTAVAACDRGGAGSRLRQS
jgi:hypothetical protein